VGATTTGARTIVAGQRWISESEPELGLGIVTQTSTRSLVIEFAAADEIRRYALKTAPLRRVRFAPGDIIKDRDGGEFVVGEVREQDGLLVYLCGSRSLTEASISDRLALDTPRERLIAGRTDPPALFDFRVQTARRLHQTRKSAVRGLIGPRVELLPHQFSIAADVTHRRRPRVLLADETGMGKTIEAGLIVRRLLLCRRAQRVLVLVPDPLLHQWLVELRRRFHLPVAIFDEERCRAIEQGDENANPFACESFILAGIDLLASRPLRAGQAARAGWDVVVVDEAHHLHWSPREPSPAYRAVAGVAANSAGLLLLSATPEQLGEESHFARLRLLDPERYHDFSSWKHEADGYRETARIARRLEQRGSLDDDGLHRLGGILGIDPEQARRRCADEAGRRLLLEDLIDRHGPGRVMFHNNRSALPHLPERRVCLHGLTRHDCDPRIEWMLEMLGSDKDRKSLVICHSAAQARALKAAIEKRRRIDIALFHEALTLIQRDRNAAWFAEATGPRLLICSEIGSEGRNFQHVQHLVLFDLPADPGLVEQRIGRLDRIGQQGTVHVDVLFETGTGQQALARWHAEAVGSFERHVPVGAALYERFGRELAELVSAAASRDIDADLQNLIDRTAQTRDDLARRVEEGRDRLLEMNSLRHDLADPLVREIRELDDDRTTEEFFLRLMEHFHVYAEEIGPRMYRMNPDAMQCTEFPRLERGETVLTFDRATALVREDVEFMTSDDPLLDDAAELLLASQSGNASFALIEQERPARFVLEAVFVLEPIAPARLHLDRFLPPTPIRTAVDQTGTEISGGDGEDGGFRRENGPSGWVAEHRSILQPLLNEMATANETLAEKQADRLRGQATREAAESIGGEIDRLRTLAAVNPDIRSEEIHELENERDEIDGHLRTARLRLDCLRLTWYGPCRDGRPELH